MGSGERQKTIVAHLRYWRFRPAITAPAPLTAAAC